MKVDGGIGGDLRGAGAAAATLEGQGYDGLWTAETSHDPFFPLLLASQQTTKVELGTGIAVAFARSPMTLAQTAYNLNAYAQGRLLLGLGSQIKAHITRRFSMPWSRRYPRAPMTLMASVQTSMATWSAKRCISPNWSRPNCRTSRKRLACCRYCRCANRAGPRGWINKAVSFPCTRKSRRGGIVR